MSMKLYLVLSCIWWFGIGVLPTASADTNAVGTPPRIDSVEDMIRAAFEEDTQKISELLTNGIAVDASVRPGLTA